MGRNRDGEEVKNVCSVRIQPRDKKALIDEYGSIQEAINYLIWATVWDRLDNEEEDE